MVRDRKGGMGEAFGGRMGDLVAGLLASVAAGQQRRQQQQQLVSVGSR